MSKDIIRAIVTEKPWPLTMTEVISAFRSASPSHDWEIDDIGEVINELVREGIIVEIDFSNALFIGKLYIRADKERPVIMRVGDFSVTSNGNSQ